MDGCNGTQVIILIPQYSYCTYIYKNTHTNIHTHTMEHSDVLLNTHTCTLTSTQVKTPIPVSRTIHIQKYITTYIIYTLY